MKHTIYSKCLMSTMLLFSMVANARPKPHDYTQTIKEFMESHIGGDYKRLNKILDNDVTYMIPRNKHILIQTKRDLIEQMKQVGDIKLDCTASYEIIAKSESLIIAKVDFDYVLGLQHNYLILQNKGDGWKISQVCKFPDDKEPQLSGKIIAGN